MREGIQRTVRRSVFGCDVNETYARRGSSAQRRRTEMYKASGSPNDDKFVTSHAIYNGIHSIQQLYSYILNGINKMLRDEGAGKPREKIAPEPRWCSVFRCSILLQNSCESLRSRTTHEYHPRFICAIIRHRPPRFQCHRDAPSRSYRCILFGFCENWRWCVWQVIYVRINGIVFMQREMRPGTECVAQ